MLLNRCTVVLALLWACSALSAETPKSFDAAAAFGARPSVTDLSLSPDGKSVAYIAPARGQGSVLVTMRLDGTSTPKRALIADGKPGRLEHCAWVSSDRLVCRLFALVKDPTAVAGFLPVTRQLAVNADGSNLRELSNRLNMYSRGYNLHGGSIIDWLPDEDGAVLMTRTYLPDDHTGSHLGSSQEGLGVDHVDTRTLTVKHVESPHPDAVEYHSDGHGTVRVMGSRISHGNSQDTGVVQYSYRMPGSREWKPLTKYNRVDGSGMDIYAVDRDLNVAYGFKKKDGLRALYSVTLDAQPHEELIYSRTDVDVDSLIQIGRRQHVVGAEYALDSRQAAYFDPNVKSLLGVLSKALPQSALGVMESSADEQKMLIFSGSDRDPGVYYIFDRPSKQLQTFLVARGELEGVTLATMKPVSYPASDGTSIPAFLTLPPGKESAKGLPAIVMPHGGPSSRDHWGFDYLAQFYAARGFAVIQPNYRGSTGYGDAWVAKNGFRSWPTAIGDVLDAGRWLVHEGIADPAKLAIVGWSYGGYAALQSSVVDPNVFKAVVAIAPVTDLGALKDEFYYWSDYNLISDFVGDGKTMHEGSPIEHADRIKVPVLLFHGEFDRNVSVNQSKRMAARLQAAGGRCELVTWPDLDHQLEDSAARAQMLRKSDEFLRKELALGQ
jgi:dipeptidyl aminopeptidase/acylaminoacyl peptidase